jgi:iron complex transport system substrate-binding protein
LLPGTVSPRAQTLSAPGATAKVDTSRLVVAGGGITEILYVLGAQDRIVAVDTTSMYPPEALKTKPNVGYMRALSTEGVLAMRPSAIIASDKSGPPEVIKALRSASVPFIEIDDGTEPEALLRRVRLVAGLVGKSAEGEALAQSIEKGFASLAEKRRTIRSPKRAVFVLSIQSGRMTVAGKHSSADSMLRLAGVANGADAIEGFKPITNEALVAINPDVIIVGSHGGPTARIDELMKIPGLELTTAGAKRNFVAMDTLYLLGFGPRAPAAALDLMHAIYPETKADASR